jgi:predicted O-linked N-acetylglucosamine transferase (SPINDLY family)
MRILDAVPNSVLWLLEYYAPVSLSLRREAEARGISGDRLVFATMKPLPQHLARYRIADIALDTFPYNSHTTASDSLWAGCPLVTLAGESFASRVAGSLLHGVGLPELVTTSLADYERLAVRLGTQPRERAAIRAKLAANRDRCALFDTPRFVAHLEAAYERMWAIHAAGEPPRHIDVAESMLPAAE